MSEENAFYRDLFSPWGELSMRKMFGGLGLYHQDKMFALVADGELYFKVDEHSAAQFKAARSKPFTYKSKGKNVSLSYWLAPPEIFDDSEALIKWSNIAWAAAERTKEIKTKKKKR
jgi:DNA transformation protein